MAVHKDTQVRESWCISRVSAILRDKYREEFDAHMGEFMDGGDAREKARNHAKKIIRQRHPEEAAVLKMAARLEWDEKHPAIAQEILERKLDSVNPILESNKRRTGIKRQLGISVPALSGNEAEAMIRDNYRWIQEKRRGR